MKRMLTTEQIKKVENNCGMYKGATKPLFVPFTKESNYFSGSKTLELEITIDFTDCLPGYTYVLDWWNPKTNDSDKYLNHNWPSDTWAEAINKWRDITNIKLRVNIYGLKSGIDFEMPLSLFAIDKNNLLIQSIAARVKDEDKDKIFPIIHRYDEVRDNEQWQIASNHINPFTLTATPYPLDITFYLTTNGALVNAIGGY